MSLGPDGQQPLAGQTAAHETHASGSQSLKIVTEIGSSVESGLSQEREKKEMSDLNDRLALYIEKVRFLEAQNRKLFADVERLSKKWGKKLKMFKIS
uniref:IF rod domain-containing protein n=1 Tax=Panagrolaimus superbus TaxID=310955 RepID=A0A914YZA5_9BILA